MQLLSRLEHDSRLAKAISAGQRTAPQPAFRTREVGGAIQVCLPGAG
jgi:hypothetical protein